MLGLYGTEAVEMRTCHPHAANKTGKVSLLGPQLKLTNLRWKAALTRDEQIAFFTKGSRRYCYLEQDIFGGGE
jgi:hypothetical protein